MSSATPRRRHSSTGRGWRRTRPATACGRSATRAAPRRRPRRRAALPGRADSRSLYCPIIAAMPRRIFTFHASPYLLLSLTSFIWSLNWVIARAIVGHVSPFALACIRWIVAVAVILPVAWPEIRAHWPAIRNHWRTIVWLAFWGTGLHNVFAYAGAQYTTATNGVILNSSIPIMIVILGWLIYRDTITKVQALGVAVSAAGVLAILTRGDPAVLADMSLNKGDLIVLIGMVFWAAYTVFLRMKPAELLGLAMLAACGCVGVAILAPLAAIEIAFFGG